MPTITIPENLINNDDLVVIPRREYESLVYFKMKKIGEIELTAKQKKSISQSEKELKNKEYFTLNELEQHLARPHSKTRS